MDEETRRALEDVRGRIRWFAEQHEREWRDSGGWRTRWGAELDALEAEVALLHASLRTLEARVSEVERATTATADMVKAGLEGFARAVSGNVRKIINADRKTILKELDELRGMVQAVAAELADQRSEMRAGIQGLSQQLSEYEARLRVYEEKQLGDGNQ